MATTMTNKPSYHLPRKKALAKAMCLKLCTMTSIILRIKSCLYQAPTPVTSECDDVTGDADDEWGIIHNPDVQRTGCQSSRVRMETTSLGVQVSLVIVVAVSPHVPHLQRTRAKWTFDDTTSYSRIKRLLVQKPMFDVGFLTSSHFDAYVSDRLEFAARRYSEWILGSRRSCAPPIVHATTHASRRPVCEQPSPKTGTMTPKKSKKTAKLSRPKELKSTAERSTQQVPPKTSKPPDNSVHHHAKNTPTKKMVKRVSMPWVQPVDPRYMNYEQSEAYRSKRLENQTRRRALQSSRHGP